MKRKHLVQIMFGETGAAQVSELSQHLHVSHRFVVYSGLNIYSCVCCELSNITSNYQISGSRTAAPHVGGHMCPCID